MVVARTGATHLAAVASLPSSSCCGTSRATSAMRAPHLDTVMGFDESRYDDLRRQHCAPGGERPQPHARALGRRPLSHYNTTIVNAQSVAGWCRSGIIMMGRMMGRLHTIMLPL